MRHGITAKLSLIPEWEQAATMLRRNVLTLHGHGDDWSRLRRAARAQMIADALRYTSAYRDVGWAEQLVARQPDGALNIVMAGHQPTLFHPGVWFKNFVLGRIANQTDSLAINLVIDNDVAGGGSIRVPTLRAGSDEVVYTNVAYDRDGGGMPFEQTTVDDREVFDRFDQEVRREIEPLVKAPCVGELWRHATAAIDRCGVAGCALAQARHGLEADIGLQTLELPMSVASRGESFARFVFSILSDLSRFHDSYNSSTRVYRKAHRIRSTAHPVPDLNRDEEDGATWLEAPLWVYGNDSPTRKPVWAKVVGDVLTIGDRRGWELRLDLRHRDDAVAQLAASAGLNCKLRPRALLTTMYARCILSDLFLHGIGGGKYDQLGDMITRSFFQWEPTDFMVVSATIHLPGVRSRDFDSDIRRVRRRLRETEFQPENFADQAPLDPNALKRKIDLLSRIPPRGQRQDWHREITHVNRILSASLAEARGALRQELAGLRSAKESQARLTSREHSFCLFPLDYLVSHFDSLLAPSRSLSPVDQDLSDQ